MTKNLILLFFCFFIWQNLFSQNMTSYFKNQQTFPFQKLYLHTDREFYFSDDTLWFSAYLVEAESHIPTPESCNLYIDLISNESVIIKKKLFNLQNGFGSGYVSLSDSVGLEGNFLLRASTDYLKNFGDDAFFTKTIQVSGIKNSAELVDSDTVNLISDDVDIQFFPEGGFLLADKINPIAFKATDNKGIDVDIKGNLLDETGMSIFTFNTVYKGMGMIYFIPKANSKYTIEIEEHPEMNPELPEIRTEGAKLLIVKKDENKITLNIITSEKDPKNPFYLAVMHRGKVIYHLKIERYQTAKTLRIKTKPLQEGINRLILLNHKFEPLSERLIFIDKNETIDLKIDLNKNKFSTREEVSVQIEKIKTFQKNENAHLSLVVLDENAVNALGISQNIKSYFLLDSELKGKIDSPANYFVDDEKLSSEKKLNLLMLVNGWKNYVWNNLEKEKIPIQFTPLAGITLSGNVQTPNKKRFLSNAEVTLDLFTGDEYQKLSVISNLNGHFEFRNLWFYDTATVILQGKNSKNNLRTHLEIDNSYLNLPGVNDETLLPLTQFSGLPVSLYRLKYFNDMKLREFHPDLNTKMIQDVNVVAEKKKPYEGNSKFYGEPSRSIKIEEQHSYYPSVIEYLRGRWPGIMSKGPKFFINGIEVNGTEGFPSSEIVETLTMADIDKIDAIYGAKSAILGMSGLGGAINIITKKGGERTFEPGLIKIPGTIVQKIKGFEPFREFYSPKYTLQNMASKEPDFRTTLYWNPSLKLQNGSTEVSFFTCDNVSRYKIFVEGITDTGKICLGSGEFEVNSRK